MKFVTGKTTKAISYQTIAEGGLNNQSVTVHGAVHALRDMGGITFLTLRMADGAIQCVCNPQVLSDGLCEECTVAAVRSGPVRIPCPRRLGDRGGEDHRPILPRRPHARLPGQAKTGYPPGR